MPRAIPELGRWRDATVIRGTRALSGKTSGVGPLIEGQGGAGGSGLVELTRERLARDSPNHLKAAWDRASGLLGAREAQVRRCDESLFEGRQCL